MNPIARSIIIGAVIIGAAIVIAFSENIPLAMSSYMMVVVFTIILTD